jgi:Mn2+/Fe2+ NRAMP family transporter
MCFDSLINGEYDEKPMRQLVTEELTSAYKDGAVAALVVLVVLATSGTPLALVAGASAGAFVLGVALHQAVLVTAISLLRLHASRTVRTPEGI